MPVMLERWNDDKMDALEAKVERIEVELRDLRQDTKAGFERMQRTMVQAAVGLSGSILVAFATAMATQL